MRHRTLWIGLLVLMTAPALVTAQVGGKLVSGGNPTPGTPQPEPPNLSDRVTLTGCLQPAPRNAGNGESPDTNTPSDAHFVLASAQRLNRVPPGTGGSPLTATPISRTYRLEGLDSQFSPFVNAKVEISGEIKPASIAGTPPTLLVEFVQKIDSSTSTSKLDEPYCRQ